jgi:hypothetical protein
LPALKGRNNLCWLVLAIWAVGWAAAAAEPATPTPDAFARELGASGRFRPGAAGTFDFQTERIAGTLRVDGPYHGLARLVDRRTGRQVIDPRYSALNLFKLMSVNQVLDQPRVMERTSCLRDGAVEIRWPASAGHRAELVARYRIVPPAAVDLAVTVRPQGSYPAYELFLSSYFDRRFRPHVYLAGAGGGGPEWVVPTASDVFRGTVLVFPRDAFAARHCLDGRWLRDERGSPVVQMCPVRHYAGCVAVMADPETRLGVVLLSRPSCCYAISTRYHAEREADRLTSYSAFDCSLFGADASPGVELRAAVRLALVDLDGDLSRALALYQAYLAAPKGTVPFSRR